MLADEIIVVDDGRVLQRGRCRDVYQRPASAQVGRLLGIENLFEGVAGDGAPPVGVTTDLEPGTRLLWQVPTDALRVLPPDPSASDTGGATTSLGDGLVTDVIDLGRTVEVVVSLHRGVQLRARSRALPDLSVGAACRVETDPDAVSVWSAAAAPGAPLDDFGMLA